MEWRDRQPIIKCGPHAAVAPGAAPAATLRDPRPLLGSLTMTDVGGSLTCIPDYSPISASSLLVEVYNAGMPVLSMSGLGMPFIQVTGSEFPRGCGKLDQWPLLCLWSEWQTSRLIIVNGIAVVGDEVRVIAEGSVEVVAISEIQLSTSGISTLQILGAGGTSFAFPHRPPPLDKEIDLLTGNVILKWQASIVYKDISVAVTDDVTQTAVVYSVPGSALEVDLGALRTNGRIFCKFCLGQDTTVNPAEIFSFDHRLHGGLNHFALGDADLSSDASGLVVSNIGSSGQDGVSVALGNFVGVGIRTICELPPMPPGASVSFATKIKATSGSDPGTLRASRVTVTRDLVGAHFTPSDDSGVPATYTLRAGLGNLTSHVITELSGDFPIGFPPPELQNLRYSPTWRGPTLVHVFHIEDGYVTSDIDPLDRDDLCLFDRLEFEIDEPGPFVDQVVGVEIKGLGVPFLMFGEEEQKPARMVAVPTPGPGSTPRPRQSQMRVVGTLPSPGAPELRFENLGSSGQDGVSFNFGSTASECSITFGPISPPVGVPGGVFTVGATGAVFGESQFVGSVSMADLGSSLALTPDYSPIAATSYGIHVLDQGVAVASFPGLTSPVIGVQESMYPTRCGKLNLWPVLCLWFEWQNQRVITVNGVVAVGDEIRVIAEGSIEVDAIGALELSTLGIPELTITDASSTTYMIPTITDLAASVNPADGHVIVSWTNPVVYGGGDVVMGDTVIPLASPAPEQVDIGVPPSDLIYIWIKLFFEKHCIVIVIDIPLLLAGGGPEFQRGDANGDTATNIADAITLLSYLFSGGAAPGCLSSGDANDDATVNIGDPIYLLSYLFSAGAPPAAPFPGCGPDPTEPALSCVSSSCP